MKKNIYRTTMISINNTVEAKSLEEKLRITTQTKEPIESVAPIIYTEKKDGVLPQYDPRTDKWEVAQHAMGRVAATLEAKGDENPSNQTTGTETTTTETKTE